MNSRYISCVTLEELLFELAAQVHRAYLPSPQVARTASFYFSGYKQRFLCFERLFCKLRGVLLKQAFPFIHLCKYNNDLIKTRLSHDQP